MKRRGAFTTVELVLAVALLGIQAFILGPPLAQMVSAYNLVSVRRAALAQGRAALGRMVQEIRLIPGTAQITNISSSTQFQFQYPAGTSITYSLNGTNLNRNADILARNVSFLEFKYYNAAGVETSTIASVRSIRVTLTISVSSDTGTIPLQTWVFLRSTGSYYGNFTSP